MKEFLASSLSDVAFIMLINANIYEQDSFLAQLSWAGKQFCNLGTRLTIIASQNLIRICVYFDLSEFEK